MTAPRKIRSNRGTETVEVYTVHTTFHQLSTAGNVKECYGYGKSVHNQKIECFWSQFLSQYLVRWRQIFCELELSDLWQFDDEIDRVALLYIYTPIIQTEVSIFREEYNNYPMRRNHLSRLPCGRPYDNDFLGNTDNDFSIPIDNSWLQLARERLPPDFDPDQYLDPAIAIELDLLMIHSPLGSEVHVGNAKDQYLFLRDHLRRQ